MAIIDSAVMPLPPGASRVVLVLDKNNAGQPTLASRGDTSVVCGACKALLIQDITLGQVLGIVIKCPGCDAYSDFVESSGGAWEPVAMPPGNYRLSVPLTLPPTRALVAKEILNDPAAAWQPSAGFLEGFPQEG